MVLPPPVRSEAVMTQPASGGLGPRPATAADVPQLAAALADAFMQDPVYTWMLPGRLRIRSRLKAMFTAELQQYALPGGTVWTSAGYDGAVVELPPGRWQMASSITPAQAFTWARAFGTRLPLAARVARAMEQHHLREPHFYVRIVGVRSGLQGRGICSAPEGPAAGRAGLGRA